MTLDDLMALDDAARTFGRSYAAMLKAAQRGTLEARHVGRQWITTRQAATAYVARVTVARPVRRPDGRTILPPEAVRRPGTRSV